MLQKKAVFRHQGAGETAERLFAVAAWRDAPSFSTTKRATLALTESVTHLADQADPIWDEDVRHYDEQGRWRTSSS